MEAGDFFTLSAEHGIIICRHCCMGVWPEQAYGHLRGPQHRLKGSQVSLIVRSLGIWSPSFVTAAAFRMPDFVGRRINGLPLHNDGLLCQLDLARCKYVCRTEDSMRKHWGAFHQWTLADRRNGSRFTPTELFARKQKAMTRVKCQRFFLTPPHSAYFEVREACEVASTLPEKSTLGQPSDVASLIFANLDRLEEENMEDGLLLSAAAAAEGEVSP